MATENKVLNTRIKLKRDTSANWESNNPTLLNGEIIIVDTAAGEVRFKIGDGSKTYTQLPFEDEGVRNLIADKSKITVETWTDSSGSTAQFLNELVINKVKDRQTYEEMVDAGKIDTNELYFIEEDDEVAVTPVLTTGEKIATITIGDDITDIYAPLDVNPDWDQYDSTAKDYVKNRTHYRSLYPELSGMLDVSDGGFFRIFDATPMSKAFKTWCSVKYMQTEELNRIMVVTAELYRSPTIEDVFTSEYYSKNLGNDAVMIDSTNYYYRFKNSKYHIPLYIITDLSTLTEEYAGRFETVGLYIDVPAEHLIKSIDAGVYYYSELNERYIPSTIARTADILPKPETAEAGNLISVKEVDENGKVTATDVIDISAEAAMELSAEMGLIDPVADEDGSIYVDENDLIYTI